MSTKDLRPGGRGGRSGGSAGEVWLRADRTPREALTRDRITVAAVELLDADGVARLTMRQLAARLDVAPPTLYWHVRTKHDVLDLAVDAIFSEVPIPRHTDDWAADIRELVLAWRATMLRHPWSPPLLGRPLLGPNVLARTEFLQSTLASAGLRGGALAAATHGIANLTIGSALTESTWHEGDQEAAHRHITDRAATYPTLAGSGHLDAPDWDAMFEHALGSLLAGLLA